MSVPKKLLELIVTISELGVNAKYRKWSLGDTIQVRKGEHEQAEGVVELIRLITIWQAKSGNWNPNLGGVYFGNDEFEDVELLRFVQRIMNCSDEEFSAELNQRNQRSQSAGNKPLGSGVAI